MGLVSSFKVGNWGKDKPIDQNRWRNCLSLGSPESANILYECVNPEIQEVTQRRKKSPCKGRLWIRKLLALVGSSDEPYEIHLRNIHRGERGTCLLAHIPHWSKFAPEAFTSTSGFLRMCEEQAVPCTVNREPRDRQRQA